MRNVKDVIGAIMQVLNGNEITEDDIGDLEFEADGELLESLNAAYIKLLEFAHDRGRQLSDPKLDRAARDDLRDALTKIVALSD